MVERFMPQILEDGRFNKMVIQSDGPWVQYPDYAAIEAQLAEAKEALTAIDGLAVMEINPSNYDHDDVCELNRNASHASVIARDALSALEATPPAPKVTATTDHDPKLGTTLHLMKQSWESRQPTNSASVETIPHRWECEFPAGSMFVDTEAAANVYADQGAKITPLYTAPPAPKDPWPVHYANTTAPGRFAEPVPKVAEAMSIFDKHSLSSLIHKGQHDTVLAAIEEALTAAQEAGEP